MHSEKLVDIPVLCIYDIVSPVHDVENQGAKVFMMPEYNSRHITLHHATGQF